MNLDQALQTFIEESRELLSEMEDSLLRVLTCEQPQDCINAIFRAAHTIKGSAGLFGLDVIVAFTHVAESLLDEVRAGDITLTPELVELLLSCCDHMHHLVNVVEEHQDFTDNALQAHSQQLIQQLESHRQPSASHAMAHAAIHAEEVKSPPSVQDWHIDVRFGSTVLQNGMDPLSFVRYLHTLGEVVHLSLIHI